MAAVNYKSFCAGFLLSVALIGCAFRTAHSQVTNTVWSEPQLLLDGPSSDNGTNPIVYTGPSNNTYLLFFGRPADDPEGPVALYYARWVDGAWTLPIDVLVTPDNKLPPTLAAVEDSDGYLHVIWNTTAVWHTKVDLRNANDVRNWQTPSMIYGDSLPTEVVSVIDERNHIHIVVATSDRTVEYVSLDSDGKVGQPVEINHIVENDNFPYRLSLVATLSGRLLTCWAEVRLTGEARGTWCSTSEDLGANWDAPELVASGHRGTRISYFPQKNQLGRVNWGGLGVGGRDLQLSDDDGRNWSPPIDLTQGVTMSGYTGQVVNMDSAGNLHLLLNPGDGKYVHARTRDGAWLPNTATGWQASDWIEMAVAGGDTLVAVYWMGGDTYTSHLVLDVPHVVPLALAPSNESYSPTMPNSVPASDDLLPKPSPTSVPSARYSLKSPEPGNSREQVWTLALSLLPVATLVLAVSVYRIQRRVR